MNQCALRRESGVCTLELTAVEEPCRWEACADAATSRAPTLAAARVTQPWDADLRGERPPGQGRSIWSRGETCTADEPAGHAVLQRARPTKRSKSQPSRYFATSIARRFAGDRSDQAVLLNSGVAFVRRRDTSDNFDERGRNRRQRDHVVNNARVDRRLRHSNVLGRRRVLGNDDSAHSRNR